MKAPLIPLASDTFTLNLGPYSGAPKHSDKADARRIDRYFAHDSRARQKVAHIELPFSETPNPPNDDLQYQRFRARGTISALDSRALLIGSAKTEAERQASLRATHADVMRSLSAAKEVADV